MNKEKLARINALARKSREEGLTEAERAEQEALRTEYRRCVVGSLRGNLAHTTIVRPDGSSYKPQAKK